MEDKSTLTVLETLYHDSNIHQRKIAENTGLNLAKVNFLMRKFVEKGFVKLQKANRNPHKRRYLYLLTPKGLAEKRRLTYYFLQQTLAQYQVAERKIAECVELMVARGVNRVVLWGNTEITDLCIDLIERLECSIEVIGVADSTGLHPRSIEPSMHNAHDCDAIFACDPDIPEFPSEVLVYKLS